MYGMREEKGNGPVKKQFKARIEGNRSDWHAMEIWLEAENIMEAGHELLSTLGAMGVFEEHIVKLIEIDPKNTSY
jgi:hypothetical protein